MSVFLHFFYHLHEEQFPYYEFDIASCRFGGSAYNFNVQNGINEWLEMRKKRENHEIAD